MKNCLVMGSGRSGTSMVAGTLSGAGYYMGDRMMTATSINPKGYFESKDVEAINEELLSLVSPHRPKGFLGRFFQDRPRQYQRWLARIPVNKKISCPDEISKRIEVLIQKEPFCFKDPRFCYTLPAWRPFLKDTVFLCIFRHPAATAASIMKVHAKHRYLQDLNMNFERAMEVWTLMYRHILEIHRHEGDWLFLHYNQVLQEEGLSQIETFIEGPVDRSFPDPKLRHSQETQAVPPATEAVYSKLCQLAGYSD